MSMSCKTKAILLNKGMSINDLGAEGIDKKNLRPRLVVRLLVSYQQIP